MASFAYGRPPFHLTAVLYRQSDGIMMHKTKREKNWERGMTYNATAPLNESGWKGKQKTSAWITIQLFII